MEGQTVKILRNTYWGDRFHSKDVPYLVVSSKKIKDFYVARLCGPTMPLSYYQEDSPIKEMRWQINVLKELVGEGYHIKVKRADQSCQGDNECDGIQTHCGHCSCGTAVSKAAKQKYLTLFVHTCATIGKFDNCEMHCETAVPQCIKGYCVLN
jgi:hypothetical protein